jgi:precorrin-6B methylase 2
MENILIIVLLIVVLAAIVSVVVYTICPGIPPMPSTPKATRALVDALADLEPGAKIIDLGSGWGTVAITASRRTPEARVEGYELSPLPWLFSVCVRRIFRMPNLAFYRMDFMKADVSDADAVLCYLCTGGMSRLKEKLERELKPGALVVSNTFAVAGWKPERIIGLGGLYGTRVYVYRR